MTGFGRHAKTVLYVAVAGSVLAGVSACGTAHVATGTALETQVGATEARFTALYLNITGNPQQRTAAHYVGFRLLQDAQSKCLKKYGFKYPIHAFDGGVKSSLIVPAGDSHWLAPLNSHYLRRQTQEQAAAATFDNGDATATSPALSSSETRRYNAALNSCESAGRQAPEVEYPPGYDLVGQYNAMFRSVDKRLDRYSGDYQECMSKAGYPVQNYQELASRVLQRLSHRRADIPKIGSEGSASWRSAVTYESGAVAADATCRRKAHDLGFALLKPKVAAFEKSHAATLSRLRAEWRTLERRAAWYRAHPLRA